jgi:hypothetical protein
VHPSCRDISLWVLEATPDRALADQDGASYIAGTLSPLCFIAFFIRVQPSYINKICIRACSLKPFVCHYDA